MHTEARAITKKIKKLGKQNVKQTSLLLSDRRNWFDFLLKGIGYQFPGMFMSLLTIGLITAILVYIHTTLELSFRVPSTFHTVLGLVVGLLLVFRTNTAYDRWWEGRKQLGNITNQARNFAIRVQSYLQESSQRDEILTLTICLVYATKEHLRSHCYDYVMTLLPDYLKPAFLDANHKPIFLLNRINSLVSQSLERKEINGSQLIVLESFLTELTNAVGACERINNTPMPVGYSLHLKRILFIYLITLPTGFISDLEWWAIPVVMLIFYTMVGIELIGEEIEGPFGTDTNDLPFDALADRIQTVVEQVRNTEF